MNTRTGGCVCGAIRFRCRLSSDAVVACHCEQCRRQSGHVWACVTTVQGALEIEDAQNLRWWRYKRSERGFCAQCGAYLFWRAPGGEEVDISAGALDETSGLKLVSEIFLDEKGAYYELRPGLTRHARDPDAAPGGEE